MYVEIVNVSNNTDGTVDVTLACDGTTVRVDGVAWFEETADNEELLGIFEDWYSEAMDGTDGYSVISSNN